MTDICSDGSTYIASVTVDVFETDRKSLVVSTQYLLHCQFGSVPARYKMSLLHHCILLRVGFVVDKVPL
jgi:hypothetical protein